MDLYVLGILWSIGSPIEDNCDGISCLLDCVQTYLNLKWHSPFEYKIGISKKHNTDQDYFGQITSNDVVQFQCEQWQLPAMRELELGFTDDLAALLQT